MWRCADSSNLQAGASQVYGVALASASQLLLIILNTVSLLCHGRLYQECFAFLPVSGCQARLSHRGRSFALSFLNHSFKKACQKAIAFCSGQLHLTRSLSRIVCRWQEGPKGSKGTLRSDSKQIVDLGFFLNAKVTTCPLINKKGKS
jgi:hypothetical protein